MSHAVYTSFVNLIDSNGIPLPTARVFVLDAGSTTPKTIYSDTALTTPATNPIVVSSGGPHDMRYVASGTYKIQVETGGTATLNSGTVLARYSKDNVDSGVAVGSGNLPVNVGGTGSGTAAGARTNLGAASASEVADVATDVAILQDSLTGTDATQIATGTTAQRPGSPSEGQIRRNTTATKQWEGYNGSGYDKFLTDTDFSATADVTAETAEAKGIRPDRMKYSQRVAKAWVIVDYANPPVIQDSFGVTSVARNGVGDQTITWSSAFASSSYVVVASAESGTGTVAVPLTRTTTTLRMNTRDQTGGLVNGNFLHVAVFGDLP